MAKFRGSWKVVAIIVPAVVILWVLLLSGLYQNFRSSHSKTNEQIARTELGAIFSGEGAYRAEWRTYTYDLKKIGYAGFGKNERFAVGFNPACDPNAEMSNSLMDPNAQYSAEVLKAKKKIEAVFSRLGCQDPSTGFVAAAVGTDDGETIMIITVDNSMHWSGVRYE